MSGRGIAVPFISFSLSNTTNAYPLCFFFGFFSFSSFTIRIYQSRQQINPPKPKHAFFLTLSIGPNRPNSLSKSASLAS
jgi:hypothetical protein